jgi:hypothetical protein
VEIATQTGVADVTLVWREFSACSKTMEDVALEAIAAVCNLRNVYTDHVQDGIREAILYDIFSLLIYPFRNQTEAHHPVPLVPKIFLHSFPHLLYQEFHLKLKQF